MALVLNFFAGQSLRLKPQGSVATMWMVEQT